MLVTIFDKCPSTIVEQRTSRRATLYGAIDEETTQPNSRFSK
jgi:hypothetical protein